MADCNLLILILPCDIPPCHTSRPKCCELNGLSLKDHFPLITVTICACRIQQHSQTSGDARTVRGTFVAADGSDCTATRRRDTLLQGRH
ncbi:hypothetical protein L226DRAFT_263066 [Lentinus tigrinus ALCF2SS1-7]|uniref:Hydrophobin n=1 Tax=Lentinus tigrinus ALCF2SS1-6 TaxID=1328759 RepID=A0A5C2RVY9_9APHY|nr:hypothetical protein L227DRAFT_338628 [Lentinus tigrinus ALCF2SS1-6]RPD69918.1 hypothetical protein L226DRAFT_263066 [Lentinus tigrinus ALCF2SS1-7]